MAKYKIKDPKAVICFILALLCFCAIVVLFTLGGIFFASEHPKALNYANSMCRVDSRDWRMYQCKSRYYWYTCYGPIWKVHHGEQRNISATVEQERRYSTYSEARAKADEYEIGSSYSCWYDLRNPSIAQWDQPSTRTAIILLSCGGLSVFLTIVFLFLTVYLFKQEIRQARYDNMNVYSYPNSYVKQ